MKSLPFAIAFLIAFATCALTAKADDKTNEAKDDKPTVMASEMNLLGKWDVDPKAFAAAINKNAGEEADLIKGLLKDLKMQIEFQAEGKITVDIHFADQNEKKTGTWKVLKLEGDTATISTEIDDEKTQEMKIKFVDRESIDIYPPKEEVENSPFEKLRFNRAKK